MDSTETPPPQHCPMFKGGGVEIPEAGGLGVKGEGCTFFKIICPDPCNGLIFSLPGADPGGDV